jgi:hypothetical protein
MNNPGDADIHTGPGSPFVPHIVPAPNRPCDARDFWLRIAAEDVMTPPMPSWPGHGGTAFLRRKPARIVDGCRKDGYTSALELTGGE